VFHLGNERRPRVLEDAGKRPDRLGFIDALAYEQGCHQVVDTQTGLGDESAERRCTAQTTEAMGGKAHALTLQPA
jgi:hypothetical protein